jgi:hypothetical protein
VANADSDDVSILLNTCSAAPTPTPTPTPIPTPTPGQLQLLSDESGPATDQIAALDSILLLRDPFPVVNGSDVVNQQADQNTRVILFTMNLQLAAGETSSAVVVNLIDSGNQSHDVPAEDVRQVPDSGFTQVIFRLPDGLPSGPCIVKLEADGRISNSGTIRITI